jgi:ABC-type sugar transport system ATPase subunit
VSDPTDATDPSIGTARSIDIGAGNDIGYVLQATGLSKRYGAVQALSEAGLSMRAGEVHALLGTNGAGKSTFVKILTGAVTPDAGEVLIDGVRLPGGDPRTALAAGIACIYQESNLVPALSVLDNVMLGAQPVHRFGVLDRNTQRRQVSELLAHHKIDLDLDVPVQGLATVQQKQVEIAKALARNAKVILMDEPTAWLSQVEVQALFGSIRELTKRGICVLYISHVLDEIFSIADDLTVIRDGTVMLTSKVSQMTAGSLAQTMLGRELLEETAVQRKAHHLDAAPIALECRHLSQPGAFDDVNLSVRKGEIVCLTGLIGAGRSELFMALFGAGPLASGEIVIHGKTWRIRRPSDAIAAHLGFVPEDRRKDGLMMGHSIRDNVVAAHLDQVSHAGLLSMRRARALATDVVRVLGIVPRQIDLLVRKLSGGNQQKVLMGRWLAGNTDILLLDEPTVGIDVGAKAEIYQRLRALADAGAAVLVISSDMEEALTLPDRILVMAAGRLVAEFRKEDANQESVLAAASGDGEDHG